MTGPVQTSLEKTGPRPPVLSECQSDSSGDNIYELATAAWTPLFYGLVCVCLLLSVMILQVDTDTDTEIWEDMWDAPEGPGGTYGQPHGPPPGHHRYGGPGGEVQLPYKNSISGGVKTGRRIKISGRLTGN
ncbi:hypothetical protein FSP39_015501 [Pinctada imbricata]|uniref:Uncharacterized protein n=1 Tax=Pinctada imbricata TaxID=66713 RepID=A0AA88YBU9_PINIB|nr:hypothetical protein FSP39_015501 [Pinctada imbricata]